MLSDEIDRYLVSLVTIRAKQTIIWYRKRLAPQENEMIDKNQPNKNLKDDYEYLVIAAKSAPTKKERDWAKRQLKRLEKSK